MEKGLQVIHINPEDAKDSGVESGDTVRVSGPAGNFSVHAMLTEKIVPGAVMCWKNIPMVEGVCNCAIPNKTTDTGTGIDYYSSFVTIEKEKKQIILDFGSMSLVAELFDSSVAAGFYENLPYSVSLEKWGDELYGPIGIDLGEENPVPDIPPGGIAYTNNGNFVCVFFGQTPAWPVEYIGQVKDDSWKKLNEKTFKSVTIRSDTPSTRMV
jgi:hypothetical protein